jgi:hypothetical protein
LRFQLSSFSILAVTRFTMARRAHRLSRLQAVLHC